MGKLPAQSSASEKHRRTYPVILWYHGNKMKKGMGFMWFWQRKEVWVGNSMQEFSRLRELLSQNGIDYDYSMNNQQRLNFDRSGAVGRWTGFRSRYDSRFDVIYYLYVRREDFERASRLVHGGSD